MRTGGKERAMDDIIDLEVLGKNGDRVLEELERGKLIAARSKDDFLYILERDGTYHMFTHAVGSPEGGNKRFPKDEKYTAMVKSLATVADAVFAATFDEKMNLFGVLASAEHGILSLFPGEEGENGTITFTIPGENENELEGEKAHGET